MQKYGNYLGYGIVIVGILTYFFFSLNLSYKSNDKLLQLGHENNTYLRTMACILSVPLAQRTDAYISECYAKAEKSNGVTVDHFGNK